MTVGDERTAAGADTDSKRSASATARIVANGYVRVGGLFTGIALFIALLGPYLAPYSPTALAGAPFDAASPQHVLGTDAVGRDVLSRFLHGGRQLMWMSIAATIVGVALGAAIGISGAFFKGITDQILMRVTDVKLSFPSVVFALLFVTLLGPSPMLLVILVGVSQAPFVARVIRGAAMQVVEREYVLWARAAGMPAWRIMASEVIPNVAAPLMVEISLRLMWSTHMLAALSFLGYGIQPPAADWGLMINESRNSLTLQPWAVLAPIGGVALFTIGGNFLAEGLSRVWTLTDGAP